MLMNAETHARDRPPRYDKKRRPFTVGRGPVPRHRSRHPTRAGETRSDARMACEGPRATIKNVPLTVGRGPVPRQCSRNPRIAGDRPPRYDKKRPTGTSRPGGLSYGIALKYETPSFIRLRRERYRLSLFRRFKAREENFGDVPRRINVG